MVILMSHVPHPMAGMLPNLSLSSTVMNTDDTKYIMVTYLVTGQLRTNSKQGRQLTKFGFIFKPGECELTEVSLATLGPKINDFKGELDSADLAECSRMFVGVSPGNGLSTEGGRE